VTVLHVDANRVIQVKSVDNDGYRAIQVAAGSVKSSKVNKATAGHYATANVTAGRGLWEFRLNDNEALNCLPVLIERERFRSGTSGRCL